jgi:prolyl-tRNA editing enzyme YbaK/EbsC (Cys-tRNA(Pro) deacylase)
VPRHATERFRDAAAAVGLDVEVVRFPEDTRTATQAAAAIGCELAQIVKSLIFRVGDEIVLVLTSGANRVDEARVAPLFGADHLDRADPDAVRAATGFAIGGVPPCGHPSPLRAVIDEDLMGFEVIWAAAGAPDSVFALTPADLERVTQGEVAAVAATE